MKRAKETARKLSDKTNTLIACFIFVEMQHYETNRSIFIE